MNSQLLKTTVHQNARVVPVEPKVKSSKTRELFNAGVSGISKTGKSADPTCYDAPVSRRTTDPAVDAAGLFENQNRRMSMAIYAWPGAEVNLTEAKIVPVWTEQGFTNSEGGYVRRHYAKPKKLRTKRASLEASVTWMVRGTRVETGEPLAHGRWVDLYTMRADDGIRELSAKFADLAGQEEMAKFEKWNKNGAEATDLWPLISEKDVH